MIRVGEKLYQERVRKNLSLEEVAKATKIKPSFLSAIEKGEYKNLPSSAYIQGFVKNYASYLGFSEKEYVALFRREFNEKEFLNVLPSGFTKNEYIAVGGLRLSNSAIGVALLLFILVAYILFQYRYAILNPPLKVSSPKEQEVVSGSIVVEGQTDPNATVFINDISVTVDSNGNFKKTLTIFPGKETITVKSVNRFGKQTEIERAIEVK